MIVAAMIVERWTLRVDLLFGFNGSTLLFHLGNFSFDSLNGFRIVHLLFLASKLLLELRQFFANNFELFLVFLIQCHAVVSSCSQPLSLRLPHRYTWAAFAGYSSKPAS
jgi:hypothetical protein